jgi:acyl carrier protein
MDRRSFALWLVFAGQSLAQKKKQVAPKKLLDELEIRKRVKKIIMEQLGVDEDVVVDTAGIVDDLGADSLDIVELAMALEGSFDIEISDKDCEKLHKVGDVITYLKHRLMPAGKRR